jgi:glycogen debranching enzyme
MCLVLGETSKASEYRESYEFLKDRINTVLWNPDLGIYLNRYVTGEWRENKSPTCFYPMLAGCPTDDMVESLMKHLTNENEFWGEYVIVTLSKDDPDYGKTSRYGHENEYPPYSYWRGNIWAPTNYLVYEGLKRYEADQIASQFAQKSINLWWKNWTKNNSACENYHPITGERSPMAHKHYNWSMLLPLIGLQEIIDVEGWRSNQPMRFGNLCIEESNSLKNVMVRGHRYDISISPEQMELHRDSAAFIKTTGGRMIIRDFCVTDDLITFEINCFTNVTIEIFAAGYVKDLPTGKHSICIPLMKH